MRQPNKKSFATIFFLVLTAYVVSSIASSHTSIDYKKKDSKARCKQNTFQKSDTYTRFSLKIVLKRRQMPPHYSKNKLIRLSLHLKIPKDHV